MLEQLELNLFSPPSFEQLLKKSNIPNLNVSFKKRLKKSWHVLYQPFFKRTLFVPAYFEKAPEQIKYAIIEWALLPDVKRARTRKKELRQEKKTLENVIWEYVKKQNLPENNRRIDPVKFTGQTQGYKYDLKEVFSSINDTYFNGSIHSLIRWGSYASATSYQSNKIGLDGKKISTITIAGVYNHTKVPLFALEGVIYHEILHIVIPPVKRNGRRIIHGKNFKTVEKKFPGYEKWREWEQTNLLNIRRQLKRRKPFKKKRFKLF